MQRGYLDKGDKMIERMAITEREKILFRIIEELYIAKCNQFNNFAPSDCGISCGEIDDGLSLLCNRIKRELEMNNKENK